MVNYLNIYCNESFLCSFKGLNAALHFQNPDEKSYISLVPTSAHSGDGMGDLMALICKLTQNRLAKKLAFSEELQSTVMEVCRMARSNTQDNENVIFLLLSILR